jgi:hypothetical protein
MNHASGDAITIVIHTSFIKSFERRVATLITEALNTFVIPISRVRCSAEKANSPNKPKHAIKMAIK